MIKTALLTGITGQDGGYLAKFLLEKGYKVYGTYRRLSTPNFWRLQALEIFDKVNLIPADITDGISLIEAVKISDPSEVYNLASQSFVGASFEQPVHSMNVTGVGVLNMLEAIRQFNTNIKFYQASTSEMFGADRNGSLNENSGFNPSSPYAITKAMTDMYLRMMPSVYGLNTTVMRCTNTFGRKLDTSFFVEYVITSILKGEKVYVGAPDSVRDYMYIDDHVNAYIKAIEHPEVKGEALNAAPGIGMTNKEVAFKIAELLKYNKKDIILGKYPPNYPMRPIESDQPFIVLDSSKIKKMLGWKQEVSFEEGLKKTIDYWKSKM